MIIVGIGIIVSIYSIFVENFYKSFKLGVYLSLRGTTYTNNSMIFLTMIGEANTGIDRHNRPISLQCVTDR